MSIRFVLIDYTGFRNGIRKIHSTQDSTLRLNIQHQAVTKALYVPTDFR